MTTAPTTHLAPSGHPTVPDVGFSSAQLAAAERVVADLDASGGVELAFLAGSLAVGLGHGTSDIDLYVVGTDLPDTDLVYEHAGVKVDTSILAADTVRRFVELGSAYRATGLDRSQISMDFKTLYGMVRLATCRPLVVSEAWAAQLDRLSRDAVRKILITRNANVFAAYAEDVYGALDSGDPLTTEAASRLALEAAAEACLASAGDLYVAPKFLFRRLARNPLTAPWFGRLWDLAHRACDPAGGRGSALARLAEERLLVGGLLLSWCVVEGWDRPPAALPGADAEWSGPGAAGPRRSPYFSPVRFADGMALIGPSGGYRVTEDLVRLWRRLDGRPSAALGAALTRDEPVLAGLGADETEAVLASLHAARAVELARAPRPHGTASAGLLIESAPAFSCHPKAAPSRPAS